MPTLDMVGTLPAQSTAHRICGSVPRPHRSRALRRSRASCGSVRQLIPLCRPLAPLPPRTALTCRSLTPGGRHDPANSVIAKFERHLNLALRAQTARCSAEASECHAAIIRRIRLAKRRILRCTAICSAVAVAPNSAWAATIFLGNSIFSTH
jgi:hypothetical protein